MRKNNVTLYNLIFPIWLLWVVPITWIVVLPANFLIDFTVVALTMKCLKLDNVKKNTFSVIWKVWIFGFVADFIGTAFMFLASCIDFGEQSGLDKWWYKNISNPVSYNPYESIYGFLWVAAGVLITAMLIYFFNTKICLKTLDLSKEMKNKIALSLAIFTAPYTFLLPTAWFY